MRTHTTFGLKQFTADAFGKRATCSRKVILSLRFKCLLSVAAVALNILSTTNAAVRYVNVAGSSPAPPYTNWPTAALTIQDAIDAAGAGDEILVTNGVYQTGGRPVSGALTNRVAVTKPLTVRSVNGPNVTVIAGYRVPGAPLGLGDGAVRCVYLAGGSALMGFTLTDGATRFSQYSDGSGGGVWCPSTIAPVSNCVISNNSAYLYGGGAFQGALNNCTLIGNSANYGPGCGGGAYGATLDNCTLNTNLAISGGGADHSTLTNCTLAGNSASDGGGANLSTLHNCELVGNSAIYGGGAYGGTLNYCTFDVNSADNYGGGAYQGTLSNCTFTWNSASFEGGGADSATLNNCTLTGNTASYGGGVALGNLTNCRLTSNSARGEGGGSYKGTLNNCTLTGNSADFGGGASGGMLNNCIVYYNTARRGSPNYSDARFDYSCTTPLPSEGAGNISIEPQLASASHISAGSPCREAGNDAYASGVDIDGEIRLSFPSIGCDESYAGAVTGKLSVAILAGHTEVAEGVEVNFIAQISGRVKASRWDFGDETGTTNRPYIEHGWTKAGNYPVVLSAYNESYPDGISTTTTVHVAERPTHYVALNSATPLAPYTSWGTAATNIQDAVDAVSVAGALVLVTNGIYETGGRVVESVTTNRVAVTKLLTLQSVNGPGATVINGSGTARCVYLGESARLVGLTLTNGAAGYRDGGGVWCASTRTLVSNCVLSGNSAGTGGGASGGALYNCTLTGNTAYGFGGGADGAVLNDCTLSGNSVGGNGGGASESTLINCTLTANVQSVWGRRDDDYGGGGAYHSTLNNCMLARNTAAGTSGGGGVYSSTLNSCTLAGNSAYEGGGASESTLNRCTLTNNTGQVFGGGAYFSTLKNCTLMGNSSMHGGGAIFGSLIGCVVTDNSAYYSGGGASSANLNNCTLTGNKAKDYGGGGAVGATLNNCVLYYNTSANGVGPNFIDCTLNYTCTTPVPTNGVGNIPDEPQLASASHLSAGSPCRGAGNAASAIGVDIDGESWASPPSIGCDEYQLGAVIGPLTVEIEAAYTNVTTGFRVDFRAQIVGRVNASRWEYGDGTIVSNQLLNASHSWAIAGTYPVVLRAYNETYPQGLAATVIVQVEEPPVHYVALNSSSPLAPYGSWATAARSIQDAVDVATVPGALVLVSNGIYQTGGRVVSGSMTNRVAVTKPVTVWSVNGPDVTVIRGSQVPVTTNGDGAVRCVYLTNGAELMGFTLMSGATRNVGDSIRERAGGGVWCESSAAVLSNCTFTGNSAHDRGGGAYGGTFKNCTIEGNSAQNGGGVSEGTLNNCNITGNLAVSGGGTFSGTLFNCIVYYNRASGAASNYDGGTLNYSCTTPLPPGGVGNITAEPHLASLSHLSAISPCREAGSAAFASGVDLDGELWANPPSIGCDEYHVGSVTGQLTVAIQANATTVLRGFTVDFRPQIGGRVSASRWEYDDGTVVSNQPYTSHSWPTAGDYPVRLSAYNESYPQGVSATVTVHVVERSVHYVALNSISPTAPYSSWTTAARNIQDAIDAAIPGGVVLVSDGVYQTGGRALLGRMTNRVVVTKLLTVRSVNGPAVTTIQGYQVPATIYGDSAVRCVYLSSGTALVGFTLTQGATWNSNDLNGGGAWCESDGAVLSNCMFRGNSARDLGGGAWAGTLNDCTLTANWAGRGGGASAGTLDHCNLTGNSSSSYGGGAYSATLKQCTLSGNSAGYGGGAAFANLENCTLSANSASAGGGTYGGSLKSCVLIANSSSGAGGGGASGSTLDYCVLTSNSAYSGGGTYFGTLNNCTLRGNSASVGGGANYGILNNCTLTANSAGSRGGGAADSTLNNCIVYYNRSSTSINHREVDPNHSEGTLNYSCTMPLPLDGLGNITNAPLFLNQDNANLRLQSNSPCINAGLNAYASAGQDLDGQPRIVGGTVDIGAYEYPTPASTVSYAWLQQYRLATDGSADSADPDGDRFTNYEEWRAGTDPTQSQSVLRMRSPLLIGADLVLGWESVVGRSYFLEGGTNLAPPASFQTFARNIPGQQSTTTFTHTNAIAAGFFFYRVGVE